jgi:hypothetical protein
MSGMHNTLTRYTVAALAFAFVVTTATVGVGSAVLATAAATAALAWPRLAGTFTRGRTRPPRRRTTPYELVPDDPSLIISVQQ